MREGDDREQEQGCGGERSPLRGLGLAVGIGAAGSLALAPSALADDYTVTNLLDDDAAPPAGSLREAVGLANGHAGADRILFQSGLSGSIGLTAALPNVSESTEISGAGAGVTLQAGSGFRGLRFTGGSNEVSDLTISGGSGVDRGGAITANNADLTLRRVTLSGNSARGGGAVRLGSGALTITDSTITGNEATGDASGNYSGGGVAVYSADLEISGSTVSSNEISAPDGGFGAGVRAYKGTVSVTDSTIADNELTSPKGRGGGIFSDRATAFMISGSTISGNATAKGGGGGLALAFPAAATITNSTISGNRTNTGGGSAYPDGAGIYLYGDSSTDAGTLTIDSSTISGNRAENLAAGSVGAAGGGIRAYFGDVVLTNSIVAGNTAAGTGPDLSSLQSPGDRFISAFSLIGSTAGADFVDAGDNKIGADPQLGPLADNGGTTKTRAIPVSSPAIDAGSTALAADQRGTARPQAAADDIGAFEQSDFVAPTVAINSAPPPLTNQRIATVAFSSPDADVVRFGCSIDVATFNACTSPYDTLRLADGPHSVAVEAFDRAGNVSAPATVRFKVDSRVIGAKLKGKKSQRQRGRAVAVKLKGGAGEAVAGTAKGKIKLGKGRAVKLKKLTRSSKARKKATYKLKAAKKKDNKKVFALLAKGKKLKVKTSLKLVDEAGNKVVKKRIVKLK